MISNLSEGSVFKTGLGELIITALIGKGKSAYSYSAKLNERVVVLKLMHDEHVPYYTFTGNKVEPEINAHKILNDLGIRIPQLLFHSVEDNFIIKEYIDGDTAAYKISEAEITDDIIEQLFYMAVKAEAAGYNLDYFPTNFLISDERLFYIDYEINEFNAEWSLKKWGIYYWANSGGFREFLKNGDASKINSDLNRGIPLKKPFEETVGEWIKKYSD